MRLPIAAGLATAAAAITLYPLLQGGVWFWSSAGALLVTTAVGALLTRLAGPSPVPPWAAPAAMAAALMIYFTAVFAGDTAWLRVVPTQDSMLRLGALLGTGLEDIQRFAAPVPAEPGVALLTASGIGLIAILVDLVAVRLRRAAVAGLPLLALFTVPAAVLTDPIGWPAFVIAACGYIGLLVADGRERLSRWGHVVTVRRRAAVAGTAPDTERPALSGKRIGVAAIALAILLPGLLPALSPDPLFGFGVGNGLGKGGSIGIPDAMIKLGGQLRQAENATVLTYSTSDGRPRYLRIYSLDIFDGSKWTVSTLHGRREDRVSEGPLPPAPGLGPDVKTEQTEIRIEISEEVSKLNFLPLPYPAIRVDVDGDWRADRSSLLVFSTRDEAAGLRYRALLNEPQPTVEQLRGAEPASPGDPYLELPPWLDPEIGVLAAEVTGKADTPYDKAVKLQEWFTRTGGFTYTLQASGSGADALADFLLNTRAGYCEQFAGAMAVMARMLGIPARVAIGYTGGSQDGTSWTVGTHDSHAWPELYFEGVGWLRFEPTPSGSAGQGTARPPLYSLPVAPTAAPTRSATADSPTEDDDTDETTTPSGAGLQRPDRDIDGTAVPVQAGPSHAVKVGAGVAAGLMLALLPATVRRLVRHRRHRSGDSWAELCDLLTDFGMSRQPHESPRALGRRLAERYGLDAETAAALARVVYAEERRRYARSPGSADLRADLGKIRRGLASTVSRWRRVSAALAPMSTLLRIRGLGARALDVLDLAGKGISARRGGGASAPPSAP